MTFSAQQRQDQDECEKESGTDKRQSIFLHQTHTGKLVARSAEYEYESEPESESQSLSLEPSFGLDLSWVFSLSLALPVA